MVLIEIIACPISHSPHCGHIESLWIADRNHRVCFCLFCCCCFLSVNTAAILKACRLLTEIIVFLRVFVFLFCYLFVFYQSTRQPYWKLVDSWLKPSFFFFFGVFCLFVCFYQSTRQPYWKLVDFWLKLSCVPSVKIPHGGHIESLWISDWNHRVFLKSTVHTTAISKACEDVAMSETLVICKPARDVLILDANHK